MRSRAITFWKLSAIGVLFLALPIACAAEVPRPNGFNRRLFDDYNKMSDAALCQTLQETLRLKRVLHAEAIYALRGRTFAEKKELVTALWQDGVAAREKVFYYPIPLNLKQGTYQSAGADCFLAGQCLEVDALLTPKSIEKQAEFYARMDEFQKIAAGSPLELVEFELLVGALDRWHSLDDAPAEVYAMNDSLRQTTEQIDQHTTDIAISEEKRIQYLRLLLVAHRTWYHKYGEFGYAFEAATRTQFKEMVRQFKDLRVISPAVYYLRDVMRDPDWRTEADLRAGESETALVAAISAVEYNPSGDLATEPRMSRVLMEKLVTKLQDPKTPEAWKHSAILAANYGAGLRLWIAKEPKVFTPDLWVKILISEADADKRDHLVTSFLYSQANRNIGLPQETAALRAYFDTESGRQLKSRESYLNSLP